MSDRNVDLLVIGGGMAGLTAAARTARDGGSVLVVERADTVGGSGLFAGFVWTAASHEVLTEINPDGDPALARHLVDGFAGAVDWIRDLGVTCADAVTVLRYGRGHQFDTAHYASECARSIKERGELLLLSTVRRLLEADGAVLGAEIETSDGEVHTVRARHTLLATGGFQADPALRAELIHEHARDVELRSNPNSDGEGLRLARTLGADIGFQGAGFYGHLMPSGVPLTDSSLFVDLALYYSEHALLFNLAGERFVDETVGDHLSTMALLDQPEARGLLVADARVHREWITGSYVEGVAGLDKFALAQRRGARCAIAGSVAEFADIPEEWGYDGVRIRDVLAETNEAALAGRSTVPGRVHDPPPLTEPPYYVVETRPAVTFPLTGIRIDTRARVLRPDGSAVPGLLAAGSDAGGLYHRAYAGGLAPALVFGLSAAETAAGESL
ncbi:FAD-dependent oxidoreductase [Prauserella cavernicola]|uniref:FAD-binding protein n=1 Tax=Prauserella cavernicola TaxID=2800127 RepID=A0A934QVR1_9PSEU|nr:FAD-binding protein [Prauserella cavernicola]MBK1787425.1 FAD-binding protein [Prauserella cavernicola]